MRSKLYSIAAILFMFGCVYLTFYLVKSAKSEEHQKDFDLSEKDAPDQPDAALRFEIGKTLDPVTKDVPIERLDHAREIQLKSFADQLSNSTYSPLSGLSWAERGPDNVGGRTRAIMYDLNDASSNKVWAGGVGGGLWFTNNISAAIPSWTKVSDTLNRLCITCITQSRSVTTRNKMFFGTGEGWYNIDAIRGNGIWRSLDAGAHWIQLVSTKNNPNFSNVLDIQYVDNLVCFDQPGVLAATDSGVFKSTNDGESWTKTLGKGIAGATINVAADLETEYYYAFATLGKIYNGGGGIYRSCDAGSTWQEIYHAAGDEERIEISAHYLDAWEMYALVQGTSGSTHGIKKIMRTSNADTTPASAVKWVVRGNPSWCNAGTSQSDFTNGQGWYDLTLGVAPIFRTPQNDHFKTAYIGGVDFFKTTDDAVNFNQVSEWYTGCGHPQMHADIHNIVFKPDPVNSGYFPNEFLVASDGGIYRSADAGASFASRNKTYNITQFYSCALHPTLTNYFLAGSQDNGTQVFTSAGINSTNKITPNDNDGGYCFIDRDNPNIQIATYVNNYFFISSNGGSSFNAIPVNNRGQFINAMDYDDVNNILYCGDAPGQFLRYGNPGAPGGNTTDVNVSQFGSDSITFVVVSPSVANRVYFGLGNGSIVQVDGANAGTSISGVKIRSDLGPFHTVSCIAIDPSNENHMLVSYSNYGVTSVYESSPGTGGSLIWTSVDANGSLPDMPVRWCMFDPRNSHWAILATELGIWSTSNLDGVNTNWIASDNNVANTRIDMLRYRSGDRLLLAATHGRGLFSTNIPAAAVPVTLLDFNGRIIGNDAWLDWTTANEHNSKEFIVERSYDGSRFTNAGLVVASGFSTVNKAYHFHDPIISQEKNYYRLKQIDADGEFEYSKIILLRNSILANEGFKLLANPFFNTIDLQSGSGNRGRANFKLFDMNGRTLLDKNVDVVPSMRIRMEIPVAVASGIYTLDILISEKRYQFKMLRK
jgi:hypothetical protein